MVFKELFFNRLSDDADRTSGPKLRLLKISAFLNRQIIDGKIVVGRSDHGGRPVLTVCHDDLSGCARRRYRFDTGDLCRQGFRIRFFERRRTDRLPRTQPLAGTNHQRVRSQ